MKRWMTIGVLSIAIISLGFVLWNTGSKLSTTRNELRDTQDILSKVRSELNLTKIELTNAVAELTILRNTDTGQVISANMDKRIRIKAGSVEALAELNDTETAQAIWDALPIKGRANTWGDEIYFSIPLSIAQEKGQDLVEVGDLGYWPPGQGFCIFFGPTPMSEGDKPRPASPVTVFGQVIGDATIFKEVDTGTEVTIDKEN